MQTVTTLEVTGMSCGACVRHVSEALRPLAGVTDVQVALDAARARVAHDPRETSPEGLIEAVRDAGYEARVL